MSSTGLWDVFCRVVDNHGDLGVSWRLATGLAARGIQVRLWVDDASALGWMAPGAREGNWPRVTVHDWGEAEDSTALARHTPAQVWIETFGCDLPAPLLQAHRGGTPPVWINLEYLSAEDYVERSHGLPSPILHGPAQGLVRWFYYPGFTPRTGGLIQGPDLRERQTAFDRPAWLTAQGIAWQGESLWSLFCYEPTALPAMLRHRQAAGARLLVTAGRATQAVMQALRDTGRTPETEPIHFLPALPQTGFDHLLWACDLNFVRGEDSLVRALLAGRPWIWQAYPQSDGAHHDKIEALLARLALPESQRHFHRIWNGCLPDALPAPEPAAWAFQAKAIQAHLISGRDLCDQLIDFIATHPTGTPALPT